MIIKVLSLNTNGLNNPIKRKRVLQQVKKEKAGVVYFQETHLNNEEHAKLENLAGAHVFYSSHTTAKRGVAILIKKSLMFQLEKCCKDKEGRYIMVIGEINQQCITLVNVYNPPGTGDEMLQKVLHLVMMEVKGIMIMGGDFNLVLNRKIDTQSKSKHKAVKAAAVLKKAEMEMGILDVWRHLHPQEKSFTFYSDAHKVFSRLDYYFMFKGDIEKVFRCDIMPISITDHAPVIIELHLNSEKRETLWRMNNSLLEDRAFKEKMNISIKSFFEINDNGEVSNITLWEAAKATLRGEIIAFSSWKKKQKGKDEKVLEIKIKDMQKEYERIKTNELLVRLNLAKKELQELQIKEIEKKLLFSKQLFFDNSPKAMKKLSFKLKKQQEKSTITMVKDKKGTLNRGKLRIAATFREFYQELYTPEQQVNAQEIKNYLKQLSLPLVTQEQNNNLVQPISEEEIVKVIKKSKAGKSPGSDGYTYEFYKEFQHILIPILSRVFNDILGNAQWPTTWSTSVISVIHKEGKNPEDCSSYRPISLLNVDQKLFTAIMANRLTDILPNLIHFDQTGFVKDRVLGDNIRKTINIIDHTLRTNISMLAIMLDAEKAFDRLLWPFLTNVCEKFGFHHRFINLLKVMYKHSTAKVRVNGTLSDQFIIQRGTKQGDPLSPQLFALCIEPLAEQIRTNRQIKGVTIEEIEHKIALYADDVILYLTDVCNSLPTLMEEIRKYSLLSGYKLNSSKTEAMEVGSQLGDTFKKQYAFKWDLANVKYLGVNIPKNLEKLYDCNYGKLENVIKKDISRWKVMPFTLLEKISIIKMNILPRFIFLFQNLPLFVPNTSFKQWDNLLRKFIWNEKKPRVKIKTLQQKKEKGGLALPNLINYYNAAQIKPILIMNNKKWNPKWKNMEVYLVEQCNVWFPKIKTKLHTFTARHTIKMWRRLCKLLKTTDKDWICLRAIRKDPEFLPNKEDKAFNLWESKGLIRFSQLYNDEGFDSFENLERRYQLPRSHFYRYLQVRSYANKNILMANLEQLHPFVREMLKITENESLKYATGQIYRTLQQNEENVTNHIKGKWEDELKTSIMEKEWEQSFKEIYKHLKSIYWQEFAWKINVRYFTTPSTIKYKAGASSCWRNCGNSKADHTHIFYTCDILKSYWEEVIGLIKQILRVDVSLQQQNLILGIPPDKLSGEHIHIFWVLRITALKQITRNWKMPDPPKIQKWLNSVDEMYEMEKVTYSIIKKKNMFEKRWELYLIAKGDGLGENI